MITVICVFFLLYMSAEGKDYRYDYVFNCDANGWLKYQQIPATWHDAWLRCQLEGAVLASPTNIFLNLAMRTVMKNTKTPNKDVFVGVHSSFSKGDFLSAEGFTLKDFKMSGFKETYDSGILPVEWSATEPDNKRNAEDCILFSANSTFADVKCSEVHPYMCYKKKLKNMILNGCGTYDHEYKIDQRTNTCYKFHRVPRNWTRAYMTCVAEGAHLAIVNSETEANVLKDLFARNPKRTIIGPMRNEMRNIIHLGFHDWYERDVFTTIHGQPLKDAGYNLWAASQPDNASPGEHCGGMFRNGTLCDVWCNERGPFVCEKSPTSLFSIGNNELF